jgi:hypothetical protein
MALLKPCPTIRAAVGRFWKVSPRIFEGAASSAPTGYCYGSTFGRRKREQAPALDIIAATLDLECGGLPPLSRALQGLTLLIGLRYVAPKGATQKD